MRRRGGAVAIACGRQHKETAATVNRSAAFLLQFRSRAGWLKRIFLLGASLALIQAGSAQDPAVSDLAGESSVTVTTRLTEERVQQALEDAQEQTAADDDVKQKQVNLYKQALDFLRQADQWTSKAQEMDTARVQAPTLASKLKGELSQKHPDPVPQPPADSSLAELEQLMAGVQQDLADSQRLASELSTELKRRADRRVEIPRLIGTARQRLEELKIEETAGPLPDEAPEVTSARRILLQAKRDALEREIATYEKELQSYDARGELLTLRQDDASRRVARLEKLVKAWQEIINQRRRGEAELAAQAAREKRRAAADAHPIVQELTAENQALAEERTGTRGLSSRIETASGELQEVASALERLREQSKGLRSKVEAVGLSDAIGILLRKQREEVSALLEQMETAKPRKAEIAESHLKILELEDELASLRDLDGRAAAAAREIAATSESMTREEAEEIVRELLVARRDYVQALIKDYNAYFGRLIELDTLEKQLRTEATGYANYIDERVLWIPSGAAFGLRERAKAAETLRWMFSPANWAQSLQTVSTDLRSNPWLYGIAFLVPAVMYFSRRHVWSALEENCTQVGRGNSVSLRVVIRAFAATLLLALLVPFFIGFLGWRLGESTNGSGSDFARATGAGLFGMAGVLLALETVRVASAEKGLAALCFNWSAGALKTLRRNLSWLIIAIVPLRLLLELANWRAGETREESVASVLFIASMVLSAVFAHRILHPARQVLQGTFARETNGWLFRLRWLWYVAGVGLPMLLAIGAAVGYHYTVLHLGARLLTTVWLALGLIALNGFLVQGLVASRRKLALAEARRKWQSEREETGKEKQPAPEAPSIDVSTAAVQANRFLRSLMAFVFVAGLWVIWVDVLPALGILRNYEMWARQVQATEAVAGPDGSRSLQIVERVEPVTLADVLFGALVVLMTIVGARNLPGILEMTVLQKFRIEHGIRYAVSTIARYLITLAGGIVALRAIGVGWNNVQWMAAAVTVGLGFGLQEIFANFVSGLILLFERPIRAGDVVMVNGILGKVGRIQIRATTIVDMDHKELIIPNKEFITGQVINYTLSDTVIRLTVTVGVEYGADYDLARDILLRLAGDHPIILDDPAPIAALAEFKDSSVEFLLFVHLPDLNNFLGVRHDLIAGIEREFRKAGIKIPFPQRDLHVHGPEGAFQVMVRKPGPRQLLPGPEAETVA